MKKILVYIFFFCVFLGYQHFTYAQEGGKIYLKAEASQKYGPVIQSFPADNTTLTSLIKRAGNYLMLGVSQGNLIILGKNRHPLFPGNKSISQNEKFEVIGTGKIEELINMGLKNITVIEYRGNIISLTNGNYTLVNEIVCPPGCP